MNSKGKWNGKEENRNLWLPLTNEAFIFLFCVSYYWSIVKPLSSVFFLLSSFFFSSFSFILFVIPVDILCNFIAWRSCARFKWEEKKKLIFFNDSIKSSLAADVPWLTMSDGHRTKKMKNRSFNCMFFLSFILSFFNRKQIGDK